MNDFLKNNEVFATYIMACLALTLICIFVAGFAMTIGL